MVVATKTRRCESGADIERPPASPRTRRRGERKDVTEARVTSPAKSTAGGELRVDTDLDHAAGKINGHDAEINSADSRQNQPAAGDDHLVTEIKGAVCGKIQALHRERQFFIKQRIRIENALAQEISWALGYQPSDDEAERKRYRKAADKLISAVARGRKIEGEHEHVAVRYMATIANTKESMAPLGKRERDLSKRIEALVKSLPVKSFIDGVRGVSYGIAGVIIGESGNLSNYPHWRHLWKRLGLAPFKGQMGSTLRKTKGAMSKEDWCTFGYSPRRRSMTYMLGEVIVMKNDGAYRARYDEVRSREHIDHPDWSDGHCNNHAKLLATKLFVKDLWKFWNGRP